MAENIIRVQTYFPQDLLAELRFLAAEKGVSLAEILRQAAKKLVTRIRKPKKSQAKSLMETLERIRFKGEPDLSQKIDEIVYADPR